MVLGRQRVKGPLQLEVGVLDEVGRLRVNVARVTRILRLPGAIAGLRVTLRRNVRVPIDENAIGHAPGDGRRRRPDLHRLGRRGLAGLRFVLRRRTARLQCAEREKECVPSPHGYSGMFVCFFGGLESRLSLSNSSARCNRWRKVRG